MELPGLGIAATLVAAGGALLWKYVRIILNGQDDRIKHLERDNSWCNWRVDLLMSICRTHGLPIPEELWGPPPWARDEAEVMNDPKFDRRKGKES